MTEPNNPPHRPSAPRWRERHGSMASRGRPRGRHAEPHSDDDAERKAVTIPVNQRLGFRPAEFAALIGVSHVTVWRGIKTARSRLSIRTASRSFPAATR